MNDDVIGNLFWFFIGVVVSVASFNLGIGSFSEPGMGFMPFGAAVLLSILALISFLQTAAKRNKAHSPSMFRVIGSRKVFFVFAGLVIYAQAIPLAGYNISTFLLMTFLFWIVEPQKIGKVAIWALLATVITYYVFSKWLNCQFPIGPLGF
ncbi:MAG: tripartite tricarboxylate transporter TctB family protein [Syntrophales bacterium]|nr:tripartite tricarboxylate transporter TctB family protein [Syntrophales bacterium]